MTPLKILHLDTEMTWRGGENQLRLLLGGLNAKKRLGEIIIENHIAVRPGSQAAKRLRDLGTVVEVPMRGGFGLAPLWQLHRYCLEHSINILDAHTSNAHSFALLTKKTLPQVKLVVHRRVDYIPGRDWVNRYKYQCRHVDRYVAISAAIKEILVRYGIQPERIAVARSAVDGAAYRDFDRQREKAALAMAHGIDSTLPFIGNASALTSQKGYDVLLRALKILKDRGRRFHCFIAGEGRLQAEIEQLRADLVLDYDVSFLGHIDGVPQFLSGLDILAVPSNYEGLGTIILDGIHAGCAVAATAVGGIPEMIIDEKTGLLAAKGDVSQFSANLERLVDDAALRRRLVQSAREHIAAAFSLDSMVQGNLTVYQELLRGA